MRRRSYALSAHNHHSAPAHSLKNSSSDFAYFSANFLKDLSLIKAMSVLRGGSAFLPTIGAA